MLLNPGERMTPRPRVPLREVKLGALTPEPGNANAAGLSHCRGSPALWR